MNSYATIAAAQDLLRRFIQLNVPSMCVMNGHALAGGLIIAMCHDFRILNADSYVQLTENDVGLSFANPYAKLLTHTIDMETIRNMIMSVKLFAH